MADLLTAVGSVVTAALGWVGDVAGAIVGTTTVGDVTTFDAPILVLFCVGIPLVGLGIGLLQRMLRTN